MKSRVTSIDSLKGIAAVFVILIHEKLPGVCGEMAASIGTFAVPIFFLVAGYFSCGTMRNRLLRSMRHILFLIFVAYLLNILRIFLQQGCSLQNTWSVLLGVITPKNIIMWIILNVTHISGVAWFLFALLYCYCAHYLLYKWSESNRKFYLIPCIFAGGVMISIIFPLLGLGALGTNNAWFCGIPYYLCGQWANANREKITNLPLRRFYAQAVLGIALSVLSVFTLQGLAYLGATALSTAMFGLCICFPDLNNKILYKIGGRYAFFVYIGHPLMIHIFNAILPTEGRLIWSWLRPFVLIVVTVASAACWYFVWDRIKPMRVGKNA